MERRYFISKLIAKTSRSKIGTYSQLCEFVTDSWLAEKLSASWLPQATTRRGWRQRAGYHPALTPCYEENCAHEQTGACNMWSPSKVFIKSVFYFRQVSWNLCFFNFHEICVLDEIFYYASHLINYCIHVWRRVRFVGKARAYIQLCRNGLRKSSI